MDNRNPNYLPGAAMMVFVAAAVLLVPWLGETLFNSKGEPREAIVAVSILHSGNWILPVNYGVDIPFKPPFLAWLIAVFAKIFNGGVVNEFISRLPSALAAVAMTVCSYRWAARTRTVRFSMFFALLVLTNVEVFRAAVACRLDMVLTACMVIAMYQMQRLVEDERLRFRFGRWVLVAVLLTCATLTKGPVGALLPCFIVGVYMLLRGRRFFPSLFKMLGLAAVAMILPAWWAYEAYLQGGEEFYGLMMEENIGRLLGTMSYESHENPVWYNFMTLAAGLLPWTLLALLSLGALRRYRRAPLSSAALFSVTAAVLTVVFYSIPASKRSVYLLPAYPFICYGLACLLETKITAPAVRRFTWIVAVLAVLAPAAVVASQFVDIPKFPVDSIVWWRWVFVALPVVAGVAWMANRHSPGAHAVTIVWSLLLCYAAAVMPAVLNPRSDKAAAEELAALAGDKPVISLMPQKNVRMYTINFYLDDRLRLAPDVAGALRQPAGTVLLVPYGSDTTGLGAAYDYRLLRERSCDFRRPLGVAVKRK